LGESPPGDLPDVNPVNLEENLRNALDPEDSVEGSVPQMARPSKSTAPPKVTMVQEEGDTTPRFSITEDENEDDLSVRDSALSDGESSYGDSSQFGPPDKSRLVDLDASKC
jgi:hypothetical protein